ncbi:MAG TPA: type I polyketide synthase [Actinocrinis sp.]|uniref:type I polyketide synthase n=1 Tax=Actinocrinis sp. TaxID=1920516 RepID=UPI002DDD78B9|nr:type I polyketide synthase [Actinocrinis sp.]HEV2344623.1 type I polyketide synthase [Actinocrinis sp.]
MTTVADPATPNTEPTTEPSEERRVLLRRLMLEKYEPLAIVGVGLRLPGDAGDNTGAEQFARFLREARSGTRPIPADRWDVEELYSPQPEKGKVVTSGGGYLEHVDRFDPKFFNISPKEAAYLDPQQRLVLEVAWQALESANLDPAALRGGSGGVYIGVSSVDYTIEMDALERSDLDAHVGTGTAHSAVSGRLSYFLGWRGPCMSVDTACSSSLVALHLAAQGLRRGECDIALVGGVNAIHHPRNHIVFSQATMLAPDGRCKTFDEHADGYSRSEGCSVVVVKRLSDALRDGDRIRALVRGSSVRQDGESGGLTVPNGVAQAAVMREALASALLEPREVQYVEAHGTGTSLGDPIEMGAIDSVFGEHPVVVGSVKTNIGHMEAAAGAGGVLKALLQLEGAEFFPHINMTEPSKRIPWDSYRVTVPTSPAPWPAGDGPRRAIVNSFGFAGTIATVVLEEPPPSARRAAEPAPATSGHVFTLSAKNRPSLRLQAERYRAFLAERPGTDIADLCYTSNVGRAHMNARLAGVVDSVAEVDKLLAELLERSADGAAVDEVRGGNIAFLFTGQGSQYPGMGAALYRRYPVFRRHVDECDALFAPALGRSIRELMFTPAADGAEREIDQTGYTQPALFTLEYSLARLWMSWGVRPTVLLGHSIGEIAAATIAGLFTLPDAVTLVAARARLMQSVTAPGGMVAIRAGVAEVAPLLAQHPDLGVAGVNSPEQTVVSGGRDALAAFAERLKERGLSAKPLAVSHAFHSPLMAEVYDEFREAIKDLRFHEPELAFISNVTGEPAKYAEVGTPDYWVRHIGSPVDFAGGIESVRARGRHVFVEVGPSGALIGMGRQCGGAADHLWVPSLQPADPDGESVRNALVRCYEAGLAIDWPAYHEGAGRRKIGLPPYAFDHARYWIPVAGRHGAARVPEGDGRHPLLGAEISTPQQRAAGVREFRAEIDPGHPARLGDHVVLGQVVFPGAGYVEILFALQDAVYGETARLVRDVAIREALFLSEQQPTELRTRLTERPDGTAGVEILSRISGQGEAIERLHTTAVLGAEPTDPRAALAQTAAGLRELLAASGGPSAVHAADDLYADFAEAGLSYGPEFRLLLQAARHPGAFAVGELRGLDTPPNSQLPASVLDCAMQTLVAATDAEGTFLPVGFEAIELSKKPKAGLRVLLHLAEPDRQAGWDLTADLAAFEGDRPVFTVRGLRLKRVAAPAAGARRIFHEPRWEKRSLPARPAAASEQVREVVVVNDNGAQAFAPLADSLAEHGVRLLFAADAPEAARLLGESSARADLWWFWRPEPGPAGDPAGAERLAAESEHNYRDLLALNSALERLDPPRRMRVLLVTRGAQWLPGDGAGPDVDGLAAASLWGFGHALLNEYPVHRISLLDLAPDAQPSDTTDYRPLLEEWLAGDAAGGESQVAYRRDGRHVKRLYPVGAEPVPDENFELSITEYGQFSGIKQTPVADEEPLGDQIQVRVRAAGLNFKDVLNALGMLKQYAQDTGTEYHELPLGFEASGTVLAAGPEAPFTPGDDVILSHLGCMKKRVTVTSAVAVRKPANLGFVEAAGLPTAYVTAYHALHNLAGMKAGDRVLIHAAAGGVGQAAVQLARLAGAEVYATASPRKWPLLRAQGVEHLMNSRTLDFADQVLEATGGRGVDIVLNSLNKDFIPAGLRALGDGGRFVELGKIGIWSPERMREERPDVDYHNFDLSELPQDELNGLNQRTLQTVAELIAEDRLGALPTAAYSLGEVEEAFAVLSRGANTGKLVLDFDDPRELPNRPLELSRDETYLITGGLGALGRVVARKLVKEGARAVELVGRSAVPQAERDAFAAELGPDVELTVHQGDVSDPADVERVMALIKNGPRPLGGIVHAAGVLADAPVANQTWESIEAVFRPKVYGGWLLHRAAAEVETLRFFVGYSSVASVFGSAGQSNYAAANAFLDELMHRRAARGLPALSVNWGPWAEVGMAAGLDDRQRRSIEERGVKFIGPTEGVRALFRALTRPRAQVVAGEVDWEKYSVGRPVEDALYEHVMPKGGAGPVLTVDLDELRARPRGDREAAVRAILRERIAAVLHYSADEIEADARFVELGLDSLAAVELKNGLEAALGLPLPTSALFDHPTIRTLAEFIGERVAGGTQQGAAEQSQDTAAEVHDLSDDEADAELAQLRELGL